LSMNPEYQLHSGLFNFKVATVSDIPILLWPAPRALCSTWPCLAMGGGATGLLLFRKARHFEDS
jgi:hypothetical protein